MSHETCAISRLPIAEGEEVYWLLITANPHTIGSDRRLVRGYRPTDFWFPRTIPALAKYEEYGRIYDFESEPNLTGAVLDLLKFDMCAFESEKWPHPQGMKNVAKENLDMDSLIDWLSEGVVFVDKNAIERRYRDDGDEEEEEFLPVRPLPTTMLLIKKTVWESLCSMEVNLWGNEISLMELSTGIERFIRRAEIMKDQYLSLNDRLGPNNSLLFSDDDVLARELQELHQHPVFCVTTAEHVSGLCTAYLEDMLTKNEFRAVLQRVAEFAHVNGMLGITRHTWHPTTHHGSQLQSREVHMEMALRIARIAFEEESQALSEASEEFDPTDDNDRTELRYHNELRDNLYRLKQKGP